MVIKKIRRTEYIKKCVRPDCKCKDFSSHAVCKGHYWLCTKCKGQIGNIKMINAMHNSEPKLPIKDKLYSK